MFQREQVLVSGLLYHTDFMRRPWGCSNRNTPAAFPPRPSQTEQRMPGGNLLHWALVALVIAIVAAVLGFGGVAGAAAGIAKILFFVFLVIFVVVLVVSLVGRGAAP